MFKIFKDTSITIPPSVFEQLNSEDLRYLLTWYNTSALLPLSPPQNSSNYSFVVDSEVLGFTIPNLQVMNTSQPIVLQFASMRALSGMVSNSAM